jgi:hypothetical protein
MEINKLGTTFTVGDFNRAIESMKRNQTAAVNSIGRAAVMACYAANVGFTVGEGDDAVTTPSAEAANALFKVLSKGVKKTTLVAIFEEHCNLAYISGNWVHYPKAAKGWSEAEVKTIKAACMMWESYKPAAKEQDSADIADLFDTFVDALVKRSAKGKLTNAEYLERIVLLKAEIKGEIADKALVSEVEESQGV